MRLDPELLDGPPGAAARVLTLARCADVDEAAARFHDPTDAEALHDLRVALRRLRSTLRLLAPLLGGAAGEKAPRRLRKAARLTGPARDAEVLRAWLDEARPQLQAPYRGALDWLVDRVERRLARGRAEVAAAALPRLGRATERLGERLAGPVPAATPPRRPPGAPAPALPATFSAALAGLLRAQTVALREALRKVVGPEDAGGLHAVRIEGKRLRYLLEPLRGVDGSGADEAVSALKALQDALGEWHDAWQFQQSLKRALTEAAAERVRWRGKGASEVDLRPGLLALQKVAADRGARLAGRIEAGWLGARGTPLLDLAYAVVAALEARREAGAPAEAGASGRRLLLTGLPPELGGGSSEDVEQGWLPGDRAHEHVGVVRGAAGERWFRRLAAGHVAAAEAPISRADFEALWPLTEGRRVSHRSHRSGAAPGWRFDEYLDRRLVVAVAEAQDAGEPPAWLEPLLVRDITGERSYTDELLARRPPRPAVRPG